MAHLKTLPTSSALAVNGQGLAEANMGIAFGDTDGNGLPDVLITHFFGEHDTLWRALRRPGRPHSLSRSDQRGGPGHRQPPAHRLGHGPGRL